MFCAPYFRRRDGRSIRSRVQAGPYTPKSTAQFFAAPSGPYTPLQIAQAYGIPTGQFDGTGTVVGIVELGGAFSPTDYAAYMQMLGITKYKMPVVFGMQQDDPHGANVEVMMDAEIVGAIAPQAKIQMYFAPNVGNGIAQGIQAAFQGGCHVVSLSWGASERNWSASDMQVTDTALQMGPVYVAAGDNGSSDNSPGINVDYPSSSPYAIGCGGTALSIVNGQRISETVWNDGNRGGATGGGYSAKYAMPSFQHDLVNGSKRGVPDACGVADPETGWLLLADGQQQVVGGTSAVAPLWAAIHALLIQKNGGQPFAWPNPLYYANPTAFHDTITGGNGAYNAGPGWDACTGMGSPNGAVLFALNLGGVVIPPTPAPVPVSPTPVPTPTPPPTPVPTPTPTGKPVALAALDASNKVLAAVPWRPLYSILFGPRQL